jgi:cytochrome P450
MFTAIRNGLNFSHSPLRFLSSSQEKYGDYHVTRLGLNNVHLVFDPALARTVLSDPLSYIKTRFVYDKIKPITGSTGLVQIEGEPGLKLRAAFNSFFKQSAIDTYLARAEQIVDSAAPGLEGIRDARDVLTELALKTSISMFAGVSSDTDTKKLSHTFLQLNDLCAKQFKNLLPIPHPLRCARIKQVQEILDREIKVIISNSNEQDCLIGFIKAAEAEIPMEVTEHFLLNQLKTFLFAGHETTATYLVMAIYELARNSELQDMIYEDCVAEHSEGQTIQKFLKEILRLYSPAWMIVRESVAPGELAGHSYKKGDFFFIGVHQMHRHPGHWQTPEKINLSHHDKPNPAFMPYGHGKRHCIGSRLADLELRMILGIILKRFRIEYRGPSGPVKQRVMITAYPADPIHVEFIKRQ